MTSAANGGREPVADGVVIRRAGPDPMIGSLPDIDTTGFIGPS
ncbi:hypothetical protein RCO28_38020 [Streptomyces sp. LHD-70]|nr:hypothetical protein [Streptomyces sp. LHD-70]MDQ8708216.1 hypothetical protein [Streptomyces sp. LHD-70]